MPADFYFVSKQGYLIGGRFRKPQLIAPLDIAFVVNQVLSDFSRRKVRFPEVHVGLGRKINVNYKNYRVREGSNLANESDFPLFIEGLESIVSAREFSFDLLIEQEALRNPAQLKIVHNLPLVKADAIEMPPPIYDHRVFRNDYKKYLKLAMTGIPEEILAKKQTEVYLDLEPLAYMAEKGRIGYQQLTDEVYWLFYEKLKDGTITKLLRNRGYNFDLPQKEGEKLEVEYECTQCGLLNRIFGVDREVLVFRTAKRTYCGTCGEETDSRVFYSRALSKREAEHFSSMAVLAADVD